MLIWRWMATGLLLSAAALAGCTAQADLSKDRQAEVIRVEK